MCENAKSRKLQPFHQTAFSHLIRSVAEVTGEEGRKRNSQHGGELANMLPTLRKRILYLARVGKQNIELVLGLYFISAGLI